MRDRERQVCGLRCGLTRSCINLIELNREPRGAPMGIEPFAARRTMAAVGGYMGELEPFEHGRAMSRGVGAWRARVESGWKQGLAQGDGVRIGAVDTTLL
jgi:hypothetical protein